MISLHEFNALKERVERLEEMMESAKSFCREHKHGKSGLAEQE